MNLAHFDLISILHSMLHSFPGEIEFEYVSGHQDKIKALQKLSTKEQLNVIVDKRVKIALWEAIANNDLEIILVSGGNSLGEVLIKIIGEK